MKCMIDDFEYTIEEQENGKLVYLNDIGESRFGLCMFPQQKIILHKDLKREMKESVLRHELTHAFIFSRGFDSEDKMTREQVCDFVAGVSKRIENIVHLYFKE